MSTVQSLVLLALSRIGELRGDDAREAALRVFTRAVNEIQDPPEAVGEAFERILAAAEGFSERASRARAFADACEAITVSLLPLSRRRELLDRALDLALARPDAAERAHAATTALDTRLAVRWAERAEEVLEDLHRTASEIPDEDARGRALLHVATSFANLGETDRALGILDAMASSGRRALGHARLAFALGREGLVEEATAQARRALADAKAASPSPERARAVRDVLAQAVTMGDAMGGEGTLAAALDAVRALESPGAERDALLAALAALPASSLEDEAVDAVVARLGAAIEALSDLDARIALYARLGVSLAALGRVDASVEALRTVASRIGGLRVAGVEGPHVSLPIALPVMEILGVLAGPEFAPEDLEAFGSGALDLLAGLRDDRGVGALLGEMTRFFASPALAYHARVALLDRTLAAAHGIDTDEVRVEVVGHVANAMSIAGATERGDALYAGLVAGIGARRAREVRLVRAVALVRLGRTADARAEIAAAAAATAPGFRDVEELAMTMARCGFLADMLAELERLDPTRQSEARAQLADRLVEATYLDPHLREIGLSSLLEGTDGPLRHTIACLLDQVRVLEGLGDVEEILARAFARTAALEDRRSAAIFDRQLVDALIERIRSAPGG